MEDVKNPATVFRTLDVLVKYNLQAEVRTLLSLDWPAGAILDPVNLITGGAVYLAWVRSL